MTVARHYVINAAAGKAVALEAALRDLADTVRAIDGCHGVDVLHDLDDEQRYIFIERWASVDVHKGAVEQLPQEVFAPMMAALDGPPEAAYLGIL